MARRRRSFAPLWVYLFGLFAVAIGQRALLPPDDHSGAFNVFVFTGGAIVVVATLTALELRRR